MGRTDAFVLIARMEEYIKNQDITGYRQDGAVKQWHLEFLHEYAVGSLMGEAQGEKQLDLLRPSSERQSVFDVVSAGQEASICFLFFNQHEVWLHPGRGAEGRWSRRGAGWTDEGLEFHSKARTFFHALRQSQGFPDDVRAAMEWYAARMKTHDKASARRGQLRNKCPRQVFDAPDYSELRR